MMKHKIGDEVLFAKRRGHVIGYTTISRRGDSEYHTYLVVELDDKSAAWLEPAKGHKAQDCFISVMIVNPSNVTSPTTA